MKKASVLRMMVLYCMFQIISNFVHPVTPVFLQSIHCPDHMFGTAFAAMAFTTFLCSPFWGKMGDRVGYVQLIALGLAGYAVGQTIFFFAKSSVGVVVGRMVGGTFASSATVNSMAYLVSASDDGATQAKYLTIYAASQAVCGAAGYFIGGSIGDYSVPLTFQVQIVSILAIAVLIFLLLGEIKEPDRSVEITARDMNPLLSLGEAAKGLNPAMGVFLITVFLAAFAAFAHDNSFNYYLRAQLDFPPSGNGIFKAAVGMIGLIANSTLNIWIAKRTDTRKSIIVVLSCCSAALVAMLSVSGVPAFLATAALYYVFAAVYLPVQQVLILRNDTQGTSKGAISGLFNAARSLGMMAGPLFAGFIYSKSAVAPFVGAAVAFALSAALSLVNLLQYKSLESRVG